MGLAGSEVGIQRFDGWGFLAPDILTFHGTDDAGLNTQLIQRVSQLSHMLQARPMADPDAPPRRIGFRLTAGWNGGEAGDGSA